MNYSKHKISCQSCITGSEDQNRIKYFRHLVIKTNWMLQLASLVNIVKYQVMDWAPCNYDSVFILILLVTLNLFIIKTRLVIIQSRLFDLGAAVATPISSTSSDKDKLAYTEVQLANLLHERVRTKWHLCTKFSSQHTLQLERWIDELDAEMPPLKNFVIPVVISNWLLY